MIGTHTLPSDRTTMDIAGLPDHAAPVPTTLGYSPKAVWATLVALALPVLVPALGALADTLLGRPELWEALPPVVRILIVGALTGLSVAVAAYRARPGIVVPR